MVFQDGEIRSFVFPIRKPDGTGPGEIVGGDLGMTKNGVVISSLGLTLSQLSPGLGKLVIDTTVVDPGGVFANGSHYDVYFIAGTVEGVSIFGETLCHFELRDLYTAEELVDLLLDGLEDESLILDFIRDKVGLISGSTVTAFSPLGVDPSPLELFDQDDYVDEIGQQIEFNASGFAAFPGASVKLAISVGGVRKITVDCTTGLVSEGPPRIQFVRCELTKAQIQSLPKGVVPDYRFWCRYAEGQEKTIRRGTVEIERLAA